MKKYITGLFVFSLLFLGGVFVGAPKAQAGLSSSQVNAVINLLSAFGATPSSIQSVYNILQAGTTGSSSPSTPSTLPGTTPGTVNPNAQYPYGTTGTTNPTSTTPTNTTPSSGSSNGCVSNQTAQVAYNTQNGLQCVKQCPTLATTANNNIQYWNAITNSICPTVVLGSSVTVKYPNGGEAFQPGELVVVKWDTQNIPASNDHVFILLNYYNANGTYVVNSVLSSGEINDGGEEIELPDSLPAGAAWGNNFKISIGITNDAGNSLGSDESDAFFSISQ
jgi:hypothetical protein